MRSLAVVALVLLLLAGCATNRAAWKLPDEIEGGYKVSVGMPSKDVFDLVTKLGARSSQVAAYEGPGKFVLAVFELAPGMAFEAHQKWRAVPGRIAFSRGVYFVVLESETMNAVELSRVAGALEKSIPAN